MQKRRNKSGQAAENSKKFKYEDHFQFLFHYSCYRVTLTNIPQQKISTLTEQIDAIEDTPQRA